jgi:cell division protein FtsB
MPEPKVQIGIYDPTPEEMQAARVSYALAQLQSVQRELADSRVEVADLRHQVVTLQNDAAQVLQELLRLRARADAGLAVTVDRWKRPMPN